MNQQFQQYATSQAFVLTLSRPMVEALAWFGSKQRDQFIAVPYLASYDALKRRGLVSPAGLGPQGKTPRITEEGKLVLELCRRAGLVDESKLMEKAA